MELLTIKNLSFRYPQQTSPVLQDVSFSVRRGDFCVICGATGSGKSTLLRMLKPELTPLGEQTGEVVYQGTPLSMLPQTESASKIGFVMQKPEQQIVTDKVWHELCFGLENLHMPNEIMARRSAEMASYFGIEHWYDRPVSTLSGGQKQLLNLASVMVMHPDILILDEPTAQLDPIAAADFIATLKRLNDDFSLTILIVEHRLEEVIPLCSKLIVMENGRIKHAGSARDVIASLDENASLLDAMPTAARLFRALHQNGSCPLTVREGRNFIEQHYENEIRKIPEAPPAPSTRRPALECVGISFRYTKSQPDVLRNLNLTVYENEIFCILGGNGSGKSTTLLAAAGVLRPYDGVIRIFGKKQSTYRNQSLYQNCLALLPQDVQTVFLKNTVSEELVDAGIDCNTLPFDIRHLLDMHPYDLSGGEQQLTALAKVLAKQPRLLLMDEPTKGLDMEKKKQISGILQRLKADGVTIVLVTHDIEFSAMCADRCALFFNGRIVSVGEPRAFFSEHHFYTTAASRMSSGYYECAVTVDDLVKLCSRNRRIP